MEAEISRAKAIMTKLTNIIDNQKVLLTDKIALVEQKKQFQDMMSREEAQAAIKVYDEKDESGKAKYSNQEKREFAKDIVLDENAIYQRYKAQHSEVVKKEITLNTELEILDNERKTYVTIANLQAAIINAGSEEKQ